MSSIQTAISMPIDCFSGLHSNIGCLSSAVYAASFNEKVEKTVENYDLRSPGGK
jgi:hypothetical protein